MLAIPSSPFPHPFPRTRTIPLSPLNPNAHPLTNPSARSPNIGSDALSPAFKTASSSRRQFKYAWLTRDPHRERQKRQAAFLDKVRQRGEERRWDARWEKELREDFLARQHVWEKEQRRRAAEWDAQPEDEEEFRDFNDDEVDDYLLAQQEQEVDAMVEAMNEQPTSSLKSRQSQEERDMTEYGSDDEEYEQLLVATALQAEQSTAGQQELPLQDNEMDTSMG